MKNKSEKPLHLVIDGTDGIGKTTICNMLSTSLGIPVIKMTKMPEYFKTNPEEASEVFNRTIVQFREHSFILDRAYPTSYVYSEYYHRNYDLGYLQDIHDMLEPVIVILLGTPRRLDDLVNPEDQVRLDYYYAKQAKLRNWKTICVDKLTPAQICEKILELL